MLRQYGIFVGRGYGDDVCICRYLGSLAIERGHVSYVAQHVAKIMGSCMQERSLTTWSRQSHSYPECTKARLMCHRRLVARTDGLDLLVSNRIFMICLGVARREN